MKFSVTVDPTTNSEQLCVSDVISEEDRRQLANVELAMLREFGYIMASPYSNCTVTLSFTPKISRDKIRAILRGFCIEV